MALLLALLTALGTAYAVSLSSVPTEQWRSFNHSVSGRLHHGEPMLSPCYTTYGGKPHMPDLEACATLQADRSNTTVVADQFGGYLSSNWAGCQATGHSCSFGARMPELIVPATRTCWQGSVPFAYVDAQTVEHVQQTLVFAKKHQLRLVVKNTGHDYTGRSAAPGSLALWTHNIRPPIQLIQDFIPQGCSDPVGDTITFGAGEQFEGIYNFADANGYRVVGGAFFTVGAAGGWITGGGHSILSNELGLGVDNVQQLRAVLPSGQHITANRCQSQDLFFALRGGGGGSFAVITEMTTLVHPLTTMQFAQITFPNLNAAENTQLISTLVENAHTWALEGWGGTVFATPPLCLLFMATARLTYHEALLSLQPLNDFANDHNLPSVNLTTSADYLTYLREYDNMEVSALPPGAAFVLSSRLIPESSFAPENQSDLTTLLTDLISPSPSSPSLPVVDSTLLCFTTPFLYSRTLPESDGPSSPGAASITPAWRNSLWHVVRYSEFDGLVTQPHITRRIYRTVHEVMNPLRKFTPNSGAYFNEADTFEPDHEASFWGRENYARLLAIKKDVDPGNLLSVWRGVGWEESEDDGRFSCYPDI